MRSVDGADQPFEAVGVEVLIVGPEDVRDAGPGPVRGLELDRVLVVGDRQLLHA